MGLITFETRVSGAGLYDRTVLIVEAQVCDLNASHELLSCFPAFRCYLESIFGAAVTIVSNCAFEVTLCYEIRVVNGVNSDPRPCTRQQQLTDPITRFIACNRTVVSSIIRMYWSPCPDMLSEDSPADRRGYEGIRTKLALPMGVVIRRIQVFINRTEMTSGGYLSVSRLNLSNDMPSRGLVRARGKAQHSL